MGQSSQSVDWENGPERGLKNVSFNPCASCYISKEWLPWSDAALSGVWSDYALSANVQNVPAQFYN